MRWHGLRRAFPQDVGDLLLTVTVLSAGSETGLADYNKAASRIAPSKLR